MDTLIFNDEYFMKQALIEAREAFNKGEIPVGAVIVANNQIIARTHNLTETLNDITAHAEMLAITASSEAIGGKYLHDCTMYVTLEPCLMCAGALYWSQISHIVYGASDKERGYQQFGISALHPKTNVRNGILENECASLLKEFFKSRR